MPVTVQCIEMYGYWWLHSWCINNYQYSHMEPWSTQEIITQGWWLNSPFSVIGRNADQDVITSNLKWHAHLEHHLVTKNFTRHKKFVLRKPRSRDIVWRKYRIAVKTCKGQGRGATETTANIRVIWIQSWGLQDFVRSYESSLCNIANPCSDWFDMCYRNIRDICVLLTYWGRVTHICVGDITIIRSDNGLSPVRHQAIIGNIVNSILRNKIQLIFTRNSYIFIHEQTFKSVVWEMASIFSQPQCVNDQ